MSTRPEGGGSARPGPPPHQPVRRPGWPRAAVVLAMAGTCLLLAACSSSSSSSGTTSSSSPRITSTTSTTAASGGNTTTTAGGSAPFYEVRTGTVHGVGTVLVDGQGMTLYLFVPDKQSGTSTCYGACAQGWPPLLLPSGVTAPVAGSGVESSLLGTTHRTDGTTQVTYNKWPLYLWVNDSEPGQATGQGLDNLGGLWWVVSPDGKAITTKP